MWTAFKERIGKSKSSGMLFDLPSLIQRSKNLGNLEKQFSTEEIDQVVRHLHNDKSPGPDRFNNEFIKNVGISSNRTSIIFAGLFKRTMSVLTA